MALNNVLTFLNFDGSDLTFPKSYYYLLDTILAYEIQHIFRANEE
jgi:hypothetical protein